MDVLKDFFAKSYMNWAESSYVTSSGRKWFLYNSNSSKALSHCAPEFKGHQGVQV